MGSMRLPLPQGPNQHCGSTDSHFPHPNPSTLYATAWCDGVLPLEPFVELVVRVPLEHFGFPADHTHEQVVDDIVEEGLVTFTIDEMYHGGHGRAALRVRWGGKDVVYPLVDGRLPAEKCPTCDSPAKRLHPAMQSEGEVQPCIDRWHQ